MESRRISKSLIFHVIDTLVGLLVVSYSIAILSVSASLGITTFFDNLTEFNVACALNVFGERRN